MSSSKLPGRSAPTGSQRRTAYSRSLEKGYAAIKRGEFTVAIRHYERATKEHPRSAEAQNDLGNAYRFAWKLDDAVVCYRKAIELAPDFAPARHNLGVTLLDAGEVEGAIAALLGALEVRPDHPDTLLTLSEAYGRSSRKDLVGSVVERLPGSSGSAAGKPTIEAALGLVQLGKRAEAIEQLRAVLQQDRTSFDAHRFLGLLLIEEARYAEALAAFDDALAIQPDSGEVRFYRSLELLREGRYEEGFVEYESRWRNPNFTSPRRELAGPLWDGSPAPAATLLIHTEQGLGDTLQFVRFVGKARRKVGRIVLECEPGLARLLSSSGVADSVVIKGDTLPDFDYHAPLLSLPGLLGISLDDLGAEEVPYLHAPEDVAALVAPDARPSIGLAWAGSRTHANDANRSLPFDQLKGILAKPGFRFVSLQKGEVTVTDDGVSGAARTNSPALLELGPTLGDLADTAAAIAGLDLVITVDTAVAHLAGALGMPVWVLLPFDADWRWMTGRDESPWYPTMQLFRQSKPGDWAEVVDRIANSMSALNNQNENRDSMSTAIALDQQAALQTFRNAVELHSQRDYTGAERLYRESIELCPEIPEAFNNLAAILGATNRQLEAIEAFERAIELNPLYGEALNNLGLLLRARGEHEQAIARLEQACATPSARVDWLNNLGNIHLASLRMNEALGLYDRAIALDPSYVFAINNRAVVLRGLGHYDESISLLRQLSAQHPDYVDALNNLGLALRDRGDRDEALEIFQRAGKMAPDVLDIRINIGITLQEMRRHEEARQVAAAILERWPDCSDAYDIHGHCAYEDGLYTEAFEEFGRAVSTNPEDVNANWNRALLQLHTGDLRAGFEGYEWRKKLVAFVRNRRNTATPHWDGSPLWGRSIMLFSEQGMGDSLQFVRYASALKSAGAAAVYVDCDAALADILRTVPGVDAVIPRGEHLPSFDVHAYMLSLPWLLGTDLDTIPVEVPYLTAPARPAADLIPQADGLKIGFVWAGAAGHARDRIRSASLELFAPLFELPGTSFFSLQKGGAEAELARLDAGLVQDIGSHLSDFADTAAVLERLDLLITVDTSIAHLAGALGTPTWLLLPNVADWRWLLDREDTPWYPSVRIFRQPTPEDWGSVFENVGTSLANLAENGPAVRSLRDAAERRHDLEATTGSSRPETSFTADFARVSSSLTFHVDPGKTRVMGEGSEIGSASAGSSGKGVHRSAATADADVDSGDFVEVVSRRSRNGQPRFTLAIAVSQIASDETFVEFEAEMVGHGFELDLRDAFDELLQDGDTLIDADPGLGIVALSAATSPSGGARVIAISQTTGLGHLRRQIGRNELSSSIQLREISDYRDLAHIVGVGVLRAPRSFVWLGTHAEILATPEGRGALVDERLAGVIWRNPDPALKNAILESLDQIGFDSFHIMHDLDGLLLQAGAAHAANAITVSLRRARIAEISGTAAAGETAIEGNLAVAEAEIEGASMVFETGIEGSSTDLQARIETPSAVEIDGKSMDSDAEIAGTPAAAPTAIDAADAGLASPPQLAGAAPESSVATTIGIDWPIGTTTGWQVYGMNLATQLATRAGVEPVLAFLPDPAGLAPLARFSLGETFARSRRQGATSPGVALRALGNNLDTSSNPCWLDAARNVGVVFFEDTQLTEPVLARGRSYDLIVAGSSWNADVLRANGLDNVALSLQGIDPTLFHPAPSSGLFGDRFVVFSGGKLEYRKGQDIVIPAFREFQRRHPEALLVFGWHNYWPHIMEEITVGGIVTTPPKVSASGAIDFTGWLIDQGLPSGSFMDLGVVPNVQMGQILRDSHVGLFPNRAEGGTNLVAMELMACGIPAILSANTGHLDLIEGAGAYALSQQGPVKNGTFCAGNDGWGESSVEEIVETLEMVHADRADAIRRGAQGAEFMKNLSWSNQTDHLLSILASLL